MEYIKLATGHMGANCYILYDESSKEAAVIDPGEEAEKLIEIIENGDLTVKYILLTHGHGDHIGAVEELKEKYQDIVLVSHKNELELLENADHNLSKMVFGKAIEISPDKLVEDGDKLELSEKEIVIIHTPGHSPGGVCFLVGNLLFTGDTLFQGSIGRSDFYKGNQLELLKSIRSKIMTLDNDIIVLPGHGPNSTIGKEKIGNPFI